MLRFAPVLPALLLLSFIPAHAQTSWLDPFRGNAGKLIAAAGADHFGWNRLAELTDTYGQRLSGSENLNRAIAWAVETMKKDGLENVHTERVMIPKWVRGSESVEITNPPHHVIPMLGLGGSIATPPAGIEAEVMVVSSGDDLAKRAARGEGQDRPLQRALYQLRRDGGVSIRRRVDGGAAWRGGHAGARGWADGAAHAAHRRHGIRRRRHEDSRRRDPGGRRHCASSASSIAASPFASA